MWPCGRNQRERIGDPERDADAGDAADGREQHAFRQQLAHEAGPPCANRRPKRQFAVTGDAAREQHAGDVRARDDQHQRDQAEEHEHRRAERRHVAEESGFRRDQPGVLKLPAARRCAGRAQPFLQLRVGGGFRLRCGHRRLDPRGDRDAASRHAADLFDLAQFLAERQDRDAQLRIESARQIEKRFRRDADDREGIRVEVNRAADDARVAAEALLPEAVRQDRFRRPLAVLHVCGEAAPEGRTKTQRGEEIRRHDAADDPLGPIVVGEAQAVAGGENHVGEDAGAPELFDELDRDGLRLLDRFARERQADEAARVCHRQRLPQDRVERGEHRAAGADAQRERRHGRERERRAAPERAKGIAEVRPQILEPSEPPRLL